MARLPQDIQVVPLGEAPSRQFCSHILSVSNEMLFHQLYLYDSYESHHLTGPSLYTWLIRCSQAMYFLLFHSNKPVVSIGHVCHIKPLVTASIVVLQSQLILPKMFNPFALIRVPATACDVISFNSQVLVS